MYPPQLRTLFPRTSLPALRGPRRKSYVEAVMHYSPNSWSRTRAIRRDELAFVRRYGIDSRDCSGYGPQHSTPGTETHSGGRNRLRALTKCWRKLSSPFVPEGVAIEVGMLRDEPTMSASVAWRSDSSGAFGRSTWIRWSCPNPQRAQPSPHHQTRVCQKEFRLSPFGIIVAYDHNCSPA